MDDASHYNRIWSIGVSNHIECTIGIRVYNEKSCKPALIMADHNSQFYANVAKTRERI